VAGGQPPFPLMVFQVIFFPMQGVFNFLTYLRPRYLRTKAKHPNISTCELLRQVLAPTAQVREKSQRPTSETRFSFLRKSVQALRASIDGVGSSDGRRSRAYSGSGSLGADNDDSNRGLHVPPERNVNNNAIPQSTTAVAGTIEATQQTSVHNV